MLTRLGAEEALTLNAQSVEKIRAAVEAGQIPGIPAVVGEQLTALIERYPLRLDPDYFPGGRFFHLEDDAFRGAYVLTDALLETWDHSVVQGIRTDRANFYGLCTDVTTQAEWRAVLVNRMPPWTSTRTTPIPIIWMLAPAITITLASISFASTQVPTAFCKAYS